MAKAGFTNVVGSTFHGKSSCNTPFYFIFGRQGDGIVDCKIRVIELILRGIFIRSVGT